MKCLLLINITCWYYVTAKVFFCSQTPVTVWETRMCRWGEYTSSLLWVWGLSVPSECGVSSGASTAPRGWLESEDASGQACWLLTHSKCVLRWKAASYSSLTWLLFTKLEACQPVGLSLLSFVRIYDERVKWTLASDLFLEQILSGCF